MRERMVIILSMLVFGACGNNERVSREVFEEVNRSMAIKKVNEADLIEEALKWGNEISQEAQEQLIAALQNAIAEKGVPDAIEFCNEQAIPILEEVSKKYNVNIRRASNDYRNTKDKPLDYEEMILDAFGYNLENELPVEPNIQKLEGGEVLHFAKVIQIPGAFCLNCHGNIETEISPETRERLKKLYPDDRATGHKIGDLRGIWSIKLPKKEVIKRM